MRYLLARILSQLIDSTQFIEDSINLGIVASNKTSKELIKNNKRLIKELKNELYKVRVPRGGINE